jgi:hypothetical protein
MTPKGDLTVPEETLEEAWEAMLEADRQRDRSSRRHARGREALPAMGRFGLLLRLSAPIVLLAWLVRRTVRRKRG